MPKADPVHRLFAKFLDFLIVGVCSKLSMPYGLLIGTLYILISDGLFNGQSVGKKVFRLRVITLSPDGHQAVCSFKDSMIRNAAFAGFVLLSYIPVLNIFVILVAAIFTLLEAYFVIIDDRGIRIGDIYAQSQVIDDKTSQASDDDQLSQ